MSVRRGENNVGLCEGMDFKATKIAELVDIRISDGDRDKVIFEDLG